MAIVGIMCDVIFLRLASFCILFIQTLNTCLALQRMEKRTMYHLFFLRLSSFYILFTPTLNAYARA